MPVITYNLPSAEEEELIRRFTVNRNYLRAISRFLSETYGRGGAMFGGLQTAAAANPRYHRIQRVSMPLQEVRRYLTLGWASEIQLGLPATLGNDSIVAYANAWAPVHAYYTAFGGLQAWFAANGLSGTANDHTATLKTIANMIEQRNLFPEPWNLLAIGCPMRGDRLHLNVPTGVDCTSHVEVLSIPPPHGHDPTFWQRYGTWLRTTREARLVAREEKWKKDNNRPRIARDERTRIAANLAPTSLFDCLWRLRIKSNYGNIDPYLVTWISESDHVAFNRALRRVTAATMGLLELYIIRRIGRSDFESLAQEFVSNDSAGMTGPTLQRRLGQFGF
jgi:hypothetical protein